MRAPFVPEHTRDLKDLHHRVEHLETRARALEIHLVDQWDRERRRARLGLVAALGGLLVSLFLPWSAEIGVSLLSALFLGGAGAGPLTVAAVAAGSLLIAGCAAFPFLARSAPTVVLTGIAVLTAIALGMSAVVSFDAQSTFGPGVVLAFVMAVLVPFPASRIAWSPAPTH